MEASIELERAALKAKQREIEMQMAEEEARAQQEEMMMRKREEEERKKRQEMEIAMEEIIRAK